MLRLGSVLCALVAVSASEAEHAELQARLRQRIRDEDHHTTFDAALENKGSPPPPPVTTEWASCTRNVGCANGMHCAELSYRHKSSSRGGDVCCKSLVHWWAHYRCGGLPTGDSNKRCEWDSQCAADAACTRRSGTSNHDGDNYCQPRGCGDPRGDVEKNSGADEAWRLGGNDGCCTPSNPCGKNQGDCDSDADCTGDLTCGANTCEWGDGDDCCEDPFEKYVDIAKKKAAAACDNLAASEAKVKQIMDTGDLDENGECDANTQCYTAKVAAKKLALDVAATVLPLGKAMKPGTDLAKEFVSFGYAMHRCSCGQGCDPVRDTAKLIVGSVKAAVAVFGVGGIQVGPKMLDFASKQSLQGVATSGTISGGGCEGQGFLCSFEDDIVNALSDGLRWWLENPIFGV